MKYNTYRDSIYKKIPNERSPAQSQRPAHSLTKKKGKKLARLFCPYVICTTIGIS
jgi:hypothetical protein